MYQTEGVDAIASVTELRSAPSGLVDRVRQNGDHILIQKNNDPHAVLIDPTTYTKIKSEFEIAELSELKGGS